MVGYISNGTAALPSVPDIAEGAVERDTQGWVFVMGDAQRELVVGDEGERSAAWWVPGSAIVAGPAVGDRVEAT